MTDNKELCDECDAELSKVSGEWVCEHCADTSTFTLTPADTDFRL